MFSNVKGANFNVQIKHIKRPTKNDYLRNMCVD